MDLLAGMPKFPRPNGVKCPTCKEEMFDINDNKVKCLKCLYQTKSLS